jgi:hypothetical protein
MRTATAIASAILLASGMLIGCTTAVTQGTIEGTVCDGAQEPVVGAWVTVSSEGTQYARVPSNSMVSTRLRTFLPVPTTSPLLRQPRSPLNSVATAPIP